MNRWKDVLKQYVFLIPACFLVVAVGVTLFRYEEPEYTAKEVEILEMNAEIDSNDNTEMIQEAEKGDFALEDGLYQGTGKGFGGDISVAVELENSTIVNIWILSAEGEDEVFLTKAKGVIETILRNQSLEVDAVSGATYSSNGILEAVKNALSGKQAVGSTTTESKAEQLEDAQYENLSDGTYTGEGEGFGGTVKVQVTIKQGKISDIKILGSAGESAKYLTKAKPLLEQMVTTQSTNVDAVSGATYTSNGLIKAVRNALSKAQGEEIEKAETENIQTGTLPYKDGVYYGTGTGFARDITVAIVIADKTLKAAIVTESSDDAPFLAKAKKILDQVVAQQNTDVDAVSGATYSSNGILEAVKEAFKAAKAGKSQVSTVSPSLSPSPAATKKPQAATTTENYQNGMYAVTAVCRPDEKKAFKEYTLAMNVTIKNNKITKISDVKGTGSTYETSNDYFIAKAVNGSGTVKGVVTQITSQGNLNGIDAVSGATCTSDAIIEGCKTALAKAKGSLGSTIPATSKPTPSPSKIPVTPTPAPSIENENNGASSIRYKDGVYEGTAPCEPDYQEGFYEYDLSLKVTVSGGKITSITDLKGSGYQYDSSNQWFYECAANGNATQKGVIQQIIAKNDTADIDAVSGATCSSISIVEACKDALKNAKQ